MTFNPYLLLLSTCFCTNIIKLKINNARTDKGFNKIFRLTFAQYMYMDRDYRDPGLSVALNSLLSGIRLANRIDARTVG